MQLFQDLLINFIFEIINLNLLIVINLELVQHFRFKVLIMSN
jgi:hypothetical protein